jgi:hypothetical protein
MITIPIKQVYHFIYGNQNSVQKCLDKYDYKIVPIHNSPVVKYLKGFKDEYLLQSKNFLVREESIKYHLSLYESGNTDFEIMVINFKDKYVVCDGMHRSSVLYHKGHTNLNVKVVSVKSEPIYANFEPYILDEKFIE